MTFSDLIHCPLSHSEHACFLGITSAIDWIFIGSAEYQLREFSGIELRAVSAGYTDPWAFQPATGDHSYRGHVVQFESRLWGYDNLSFFLISNYAKYVE